MSKRRREDDAERRVVTLANLVCRTDEKGRALPLEIDSLDESMLTAPPADVVVKVNCVESSQTLLDATCLSAWIGRSRSCRVVVANPFMSRIHCLLFLSGQNVFLIDSSSNGTFVNDFRCGIGKHMQLQHGDTISFAQTDGKKCDAAPLRVEIDTGACQTFGAARCAHNGL